MKSESPHQSESQPWLHWLVPLAVIGLALAPWIRNRGFLRDFLDYGLMMTAAGRINSGDRPFVDFVTPLQSGTYALNAWAEAWFGGTFQAMTWGNGIMIVVAIILLGLLLSTQFPRPMAVALAGAICIGTLGQHTIIWYNCLGVLAIAVVAWSVTQAPTLSRTDWKWNTLVAAGLIFGGVNKLNFHAIALAAALSWTIRAGLIGTTSWKRVVATVPIWLAAGLAVPLLLELTWTGADFAAWKRNVIELPFASRGDNFLELLSVEFYLHPLHDYYGPVLQPVGAIIVAWTAITVGIAWPNRSLMDRACLLALAVFVIGATSGLLATNHEIVYVSLAAGLTLLIMLWIGYELPQRWPRLTQWTLILPCLLLALPMWHSAWLGQRALFGHGKTPTSDFQEIADAETFAYLKGTRITPELAGSIQQLTAHIPPADDSGRHRCFYNTGAEWMERIWPHHVLPDLPLLFDELTVSQSQVQALSDAFCFPAFYDVAVGVQAWTHWNSDLNQVLQRQVRTQELGVLYLHELREVGMYPHLEPNADAVQFLNSYGGNLDPGEVQVTDPVWPIESLEGRSFIGVTEGRGGFLFGRRSSRLQGEVVLRRVQSAGKADQSQSARFVISDTHEVTGAPRYSLWDETITLPAGQEELVTNFSLDTRGLPTHFAVEIPPDSAGLVRAGYRMPEVLHSDATPAPPPSPRLPVLDEHPSPKQIAQMLLPHSWQDRVDIVARGARLENNKVLLARGGELWLRPQDNPRELLGSVHLTASPEQSDTPIVRILWSRGGRLIVLHQDGVHQMDPPFRFNAWPAESDGWYGILIDPSHNPHEVEVRINAITAR